LKGGGGLTEEKQHLSFSREISSEGDLTGAFQNEHASLSTAAAGAIAAVQLVISGAWRETDGRGEEQLQQCSRRARRGEQCEGAKHAERGSGMCAGKKKNGAKGMGG
jgi:hypothetical protein